MLLAFMFYPIHIVLDLDYGKVQTTEEKLHEIRRKPWQFDCERNLVHKSVVHTKELQIEEKNNDEKN